MWLTAVIVVVLFLAVAASVAALARHGPPLWEASMKKARGVNDYDINTPPGWATPINKNISSYGGLRRFDPDETLDTSQAEPNDPSVLEPPRDPLIISHKMSRKELTILLAAQKNEEGAYRFSANKIAEFVGGTSAEAKGWVAEVRGKREPASSSLRRPANGWGKAS